MIGVHGVPSLFRAAPARTALHGLSNHDKLLPTCLFNRTVDFQSALSPSKRSKKAPTDARASQSLIHV
jgi:hypothetical protein